MNRQLVFVHGRAQEGLDPLTLKKSWIDAWRDGLAKSGLHVPLAESDIRFPYFGDTLKQMVGGLSAADAARVVVRGNAADRFEEAFIREYLEQVQDEMMITDDEVHAVLSPEVRERGILNWGWVQGVLSVLDRKVPGASAASVALATRDVYRYLRHQGVRDTMDAGVRSAFTPGVETVVVAHSLGTVVAYNVLSREAAWAKSTVPLFVTLGSPLAVNVVKRAIRPIASPACVGSWFNAMDERDVVALFPLTGRHFPVTPGIVNKTDVDNPTENRHGISGYLSDSDVARRIHDAVTA